MEKIVHGFLSSCLDYCNALFTRINKSSPSHLQAIQNDDARLLRHSAKRAEISHTYIKSTKWTSSKLFVSASSQTHRCSQSLFTSSKSISYPSYKTEDWRDRASTLWNGDTRTVYHSTTTVNNFLFNQAPGYKCTLAKGSEIFYSTYLSYIFSFPNRIYNTVQ